MGIGGRAREGERSRSPRPKGRANTRPRGRAKARCGPWRLLSPAPSSFLLVLLLLDWVFGAPHHAIGTPPHTPFLSLSPLGLATLILVFPRAISPFVYILSKYVFLTSIDFSRPGASEPPRPAPRAQNNDHCGAQTGRPRTAVALRSLLPSPPPLPARSAHRKPVSPHLRRASSHAWRCRLRRARKSPPPPGRGITVTLEERAAEAPPSPRLRGSEGPSPSLERKSPTLCSAAPPWPG